VTLDELAFLTTTTAQDALQELSDAILEPELPVLEKLRKRFAPREAAALLTTARLRRQAGGIFPEANRLYFDTEALQQSTSAPLAAHRARQLHERAEPGPVLDLTCGLGGDALALARHRDVIAFEKDPVRAEMARLNARALGLPLEVRTGDFRDHPLPEHAAVFADPARRKDGKRILSLAQADPPLSELPYRALVVKAAPGVTDEELPAGCEVEFVSHQRSCKEAVLWLGDLTRRPGRRASVLTEQGWLEVLNEGTPLAVGPLEPGMVLHEPDPAVIRAGALGEVARPLGAHLLDAQIAYLVAPTFVPTPLAQSFRLLTVERFNLKTLVKTLRRLDVRPDEIKKRGSPLEPEQLRKQLPREGGRAGVVILTRRDDDRLALVAERVSGGAAG